MNLTILVDENIPAAEQYFGALGTVRRINGRQITPSQLKGVDALLVRSVTPVNKALLERSPVRFVGTATSGFDHIDRGYLERTGIGFAHAPGSNANSVIEYVLAAIAAVDDQLERLLAGGTVGIIGYGVIGRAMAARLDALGIGYCAYDPWLDEASISSPGSLAQVLDCDVITLHAQLTREQPWPSYHLLTEAELGRIRPDALLINASRGPVVDNSALLHLLGSGGGPTVVLDVWEGEPAINGALLGKVVLGTPHIAGYSLDGKMLATKMLSDELCRHFGLASPVATSAAAGLEPLRLPQGLSGARLIRYLLQQRYDIHQDDTRLRKALSGASPAQAAADFDLLRKHYPQRRELAAGIVTGCFSSPGNEALVRALGCTPRPVENDV